MAVLLVYHALLSETALLFILSKTYALEKGKSKKEKKKKKSNSLCVSLIMLLDSSVIHGFFCSPVILLLQICVLKAKIVINLIAGQ